MNGKGRVQIQSVGEESGRGNLLGVQPFLSNEDYATPYRFAAKLHRLLSVAKEKGLVSSKTVVVFPEFIGLWLVATGEEAAVYAAPTPQSALMKVAQRYPLPFLRHLLTGRVKDRARAALFQVKSPSMAAVYQNVFSHLAREFGVTLVAGSIVLPEPEVADGRLKVSPGALYNVSVIFHPDGGPDPRIIRKVFTTLEESTFLSCGRSSDLPVFKTPAGRMGVLICADGWFPESFFPLIEQKADFVVCPAYTVGGSMSEPWSGYEAKQTPADVASSDIQGLTRHEAWLKYALPSKLKQSGIPNGLVCFLQGDFWGIGSDGVGMIYHEGETHLGPPPMGRDGLINLWL